MRTSLLTGWSVSLVAIAAITAAAQDGNAQLIDARSDTHLWAESYDRDMRDVLNLHSEIARAIASEVRVKLTPQEQVQLTRARSVDPQAYEAYLKILPHGPSAGEAQQALSRLKPGGAETATPGKELEPQ